MGDVQVVVVVAAPEERLAPGNVLDVVHRDAALGEHRQVLVGEIVAHWADDAHLGEEARRQREVDRRAAEHSLPLAEGRANAVESDRSDRGQGHSGGILTDWLERGATTRGVGE
jgi:hypothetical protein